MSIFSYHLIELPIFEAVRRIFSSPISKNTKGLIHSEYMTPMTLGSPIFSPSRVLIGQVAVFMQWENENALENYLEQDSFGRILAKGWHVRLSFIRENEKGAPSVCNSQSMGRTPCVFGLPGKFAIMEASYQQQTGQTGGEVRVDESNSIGFRLA